MVDVVDVVVEVGANWTGAEIGVKVTGSGITAGSIVYKINALLGGYKQSKKPRKL